MEKDVNLIVDIDPGEAQKLVKLLETASERTGTLPDTSVKNCTGKSSLLTRRSRMNVILAERVILCQQITVQSPVLVNFIDRIRIRAISRQSDSLNDLNHSGGFCFLRDF